MRYFLECTHTYGTDLNTGIQRVVRSIVNQSLVHSQGRRIVPVIYDGGAFKAISGGIPNPAGAMQPPAAPRPRRPGIWLPRFKIYLRNVFNALRRLAAALLPYPPFVHFMLAPRTQPGLGRMVDALIHPRRRLAKPEQPPGQPVPVEPQSGDVLVLLDSSWHLNIWPAVLAWKARGVRVVCVTYDLIPITHGRFCVDHLIQVFRSWMTQAMHHGDAFLCISRTVAGVVHKTLGELAPGRVPPPPVSFFWLGSELDGIDPSSLPEPRQEIAALIGDPAPLYLYVSTVEPRKNHAYALDAFDLLWGSGSEARFAIVGRIGWHCEDIVARVRSHSQHQKRLFMFNDVGDQELTHLYNRANGLVFTSITEGFGLPVVEGVQHGLPVFASDIPVFREIATSGVQFVDLAHPESLADRLTQHMREGAPRLPQPVDWLTWHDSNRQFWERLDNLLAPSPDGSLLVG